MPGKTRCQRVNKFIPCSFVSFVFKPPFVLTDRHAFGSVHHKHPLTSPPPALNGGWGSKSYFVPLGAELGSAAGVGPGASAAAGTAAGAGVGAGATLGAAVDAGAGASAGAGLLTGAARPDLYSFSLISFTSEF